MWKLVIALSMLLSITAAARDNGQYVQVPQELRDWFGKLKSKGNVLCCQDADGFDAQWDTKDDHYIVFSPDGWLDVPPDAVVDVPNKVGVAKVWWEFDQNHKRLVRCFIVGTQV